MSDKRPQMQAGFVLHHRPYRDSSLIVDLFTREAGRLVVVARGARRPRSSQRALLQGFRPLRLSWRLGGQMGTLTAVEPDGPALPLRGERLLAGFYINELVLRLLGRHDPNPELYETYLHTLVGLTVDRSPAPSLRRFEKHALECLGYGLPLSPVALDGSAIEPAKRYRFDVEAGARPAGEGASGSVSGESLLALLREDFERPGAQAGMRQVLADAIQPHLGGRPLQTARVLRDLRRRGLGRHGSDDQTGEQA